MLYDQGVVNQRIDEFKEWYFSPHLSEEDEIPEDHLAPPCELLMRCLLVEGGLWGEQF